MVMFTSLQRAEFANSHGRIQPRGTSALLNQRQHRTDHRGRASCELAQFLHRGHERVDLEAPASLKVLQHRHLVTDDRTGAGREPGSTRLRRHGC